ncbi:lipocalin [Thioclava litoralis]|uniref:Lipocalin n=1 Tax=Thioclava litoralis TaxID=3076557 RepID=A0ABZ1DZS8_9RHOB|nr:lipocalin [Thioclava sp. FTW29]
MPWLSRNLALATAIAAVTLASCGRAPQQKLVRDPKSGISSAALFDPERFAGEWLVVASSTPRCAGGKQNWALSGKTGYSLSGTDCSDGTAPRMLGGTAVVTGPGGRISTSDSFGREPVWVLWVDQDYRIVALGTPSGRWGQIMVRPSVGPRSDLLTAAREVMAFNGYYLNLITN